MKILKGLDRKAVAVFLAFCAAVMCTTSLSADEPRRTFGGLFDVSRASEKRIPDEQEILNRQQRARQSIERTVSAIRDDYLEYHKLVLQGDKAVEDEVKKLLAKAKEADALTAQDEETANRLATLANELVEGYTRLKNEKRLVDAKRKVHGFDARPRNSRAEADSQIKVAAENPKATIEGEQKAAEEAFENVEGAIKRLDWRGCANTLIRLQAKMTTREGKGAVNDQLQKIKVMEGMQKHFIKHATGFGFKNNRGELLAVVTKVDEKSLTIQKAKYVKGKPVPDKETRVEWGRFYGPKEKEYLVYMNLLINEFVIKGRERTRIGPREWSDHMLGAALTLKYLYSDKPGVDKFIPVLVRKAVKGFKPSREWAAKWFPDVKLEDSDE